MEEDTENPILFQKDLEPHRNVLIHSQWTSKAKVMFSSAQLLFTYLFRMLNKIYNLIKKQNT